MVATWTVEEVECLRKQNSLDGLQKIKQVVKQMTVRHCVCTYMEHKSLNEILSSSLNHCIFLLQRWAKSHWIEMGRQ